MIGPSVPAEILQKRSIRFNDKTCGKDSSNKQEKLTELFNPTKSVNEEVKQEILSNMKSINERFER